MTNFIIWFTSQYPKNPKEEVASLLAMHANVQPFNAFTNTSSK